LTLSNQLLGAGAAAGFENPAACDAVPGPGVAGFGTAFGGRPMGAMGTVG
jgi:hypothetical protein